MLMGLKSFSLLSALIYNEYLAVFHYSHQYHASCKLHGVDFKLEYEIMYENYK